MYFNQLTVAGNVTREPEAISTRTGKSMVKFCLALNKPSKTDKQTMYLDAVAFDKLADIIIQYVKKGAPVLLSGELAIDSYTDREGVQRKATKIVVSTLQMLGAKREEEARGSSSGGYGPGSPGYPKMADFAEEIAF